MSQRVAWRYGARLVVMLVGTAALLAACAKNPARLDRNRPPRTYLVGAPAESASFSYRIHLYWRGEDPDGYVAGFQWSWDDSSVAGFHYTTKTDSIFELSVNDSADIVSGSTQVPPGTSKAHTFFIRAVDNLGKPDPNLLVWNRRIYRASTTKPSVMFTGSLPGPGPGVDTLCDGQPFQVCWHGTDADGSVIGYKFFVGAFASPIVKDTCVTMNDPSDPNSIPLASGIYNITVQAVDNAFALSDPGGSQFPFVVNRNPQSWFLDSNKVKPASANDAVGYYTVPYLGGQQVPPDVHQFHPGDTVPYRSTVWWFWDGQDNACDNPSGVTAFSLSLNGATRNGGDPYTIGFVPELEPGVPFKTNDPAVLGASFSQFILDSLDAGNGILAIVKALDVSNRNSDQDYSGKFQFNCNFTPVMDSVTVADYCSPAGVPNKVFTWYAHDLEDGIPPIAEFIYDDIEHKLVNLQSTGGQRTLTVPESTFRQYSPLNPHNVSVRVQDRGGYWSEQSVRIQFDISASTTCTP